jgi:hypothetical protein
LRAVGDAELREHAREVGLDRSLADAESPGDLLVRQPGCNEPQYFFFARGEFV